MAIEFIRHKMTARLGDPRRGFAVTDFPLEIRVCPLTGHRTRFTPVRIKGANLHEDDWPDVDAPVRESRAGCPFCPEARERTLSTLDESRFGAKLLRRNESVLFPNLAPYGPFSAVAIIGNEHYTEVGAFDPARYLDAFLLSRDYLRRANELDETVRYGAITQNHLPASGGTIVHPHLQVQADAYPPAFVDALWRGQQEAFARHGREFWPLLIETERARGERFVAVHRGWNWLTMWAPQGYHEVWGVHDAPAALASFTGAAAEAMVDGLLRVQRWYRAHNRNSFNLALYFFRDAARTSLACRIVARGNWAAFARSDRSFFEVVLGEQVMDQWPEDWARELRSYFAV